MDSSARDETYVCSGFFVARSGPRMAQRLLSSGEWLVVWAGQSVSGGAIVCRLSPVLAKVAGGPFRGAGIPSACAAHRGETAFRVASAATVFFATPACCRGFARRERGGDPAADKKRFLLCESRVAASSGGRIPGRPPNGNVPL
ncbi:hypothetical protein TcBrA4_0045940 [Trypanosoma cruzi]|nr:hypothetical protein TcBrA4_0045940 [Trypanosoma cruzi]